MVSVYFLSPMVVQVFSGQIKVILAIFLALIRKHYMVVILWL